jgi:hypothetical protein
MKTTVCENCDKEFGYYRSKTYNDARFCSWKCLTNNPKKRNKSCMKCGTEFSFWPSIRSNPLYCSRLCQNIIQAQERQKKLREQRNSLTESEKFALLKSSYEKYVIRQEGCWGWSASLSGKYGKVHYFGKYIMAHRASYMIHKGEIGDLNVLHSCDNPPCTNPDHLFLGTTLDNVRDKIKKGRDNTAKGENTRHAKLTGEQVIKIKRLLSSGVISRVIAEAFDVNMTTIADIKQGRSWKHIK